MRDKKGTFEMKFSHYLERVVDSKEYKQFSREYKNAYLCAGFFVLDFEEGKDIHQVDFYLPKRNKIAAFLLDNGLTYKLAEAMNEKEPEQIKGTIKMDLDKLKGIVQDEMKNHTITERVMKMIAILQSVDGKKVWNLNCILSGMALLKVHIDDANGDILKFEKASFLDFVRKL